MEDALVIRSFFKGLRWWYIWEQIIGDSERCQCVTCHEGVAGGGGIAVAVVCDVRTLGTRRQSWLFQEAFGAVTTEVVLETSAVEVPAALAATGTWFFS